MSGRGTPLAQRAPIVGIGVLLLAVLVLAWAARLPWPYDLEWMEGGMLAHAWRLEQGLPLYTVDPTWAPFLYPPGYTALLAALGSVFGLTPALGRLISLGATAAAALAIAWRIRRDGGGADLAFGAAVAFLGTWSATGAFLDIVRPDALAIAFLAWSVAIALEPTRRAPLAAGLLLACATLTKHNLAAFGAPIALGLALRSRRDALAFTGAAAIPALLSIEIWRARSHGAFLTFLIDVPASHPIEWIRAYLATPRELGLALPVAIAAGGLGLVLRAQSGQRGFPAWLVAVAPVWTGFALAWYGTYDLPGRVLRTAGSGLAYWGFGAGAVALVLWGVGVLADPVARRDARPPWRRVLLIGVVATGCVLAATMRAHRGGFVNVHLPLCWAVALAFGTMLARWRDAGGRWAGSAASAVACAQLGWSLLIFPPDRLVPDAADRAAGDALVGLVREVRGPVLSPFAAWLPVYAGKEPSVHAMAIWDLEYPKGPYFEALTRFDDGIRDHRWAVVVGGNQPFRNVGRAYDRGVEVLADDDPTLMPQSGWMTRPGRLMEPRAD